MKRLLVLLLCVPLIFSCGENKEKDNTENTEKQEENVQKEEKTEYGLLKDSSTLIGKWKMEFTVGNLGYVIIEFYNRDDEYFEVWIENNATIKKLVKDGDKYLCEKEGEYYMITKNGDLKAYDVDGYIGEDFGFKYVKQ